MDLDELLARSAPPTAPRDEPFTSAIDRLIADSRAVAVRRRRARVRALTAAGVAGPLVLLGGVAAATGSLEEVLPFSTAAGSDCRLTVSVEPRVGGEGAPADGAERQAQQATLAAARHFVATLDIEAIDRHEAADRWFDHLERVSAARPTRAELERTFRGERLETHSVLYAVSVRLQDYLRSRGLDPRSVESSIASECDR